MMRGQPLPPHIFPRTAPEIIVLCVCRILSNAAKQVPVEMLTALAPPSDFNEDLTMPTVVTELVSFAKAAFYIWTTLRLWLTCLNRLHPQHSG